MQKTGDQLLGLTSTEEKVNGTEDTKGTNGTEGGNKTDDTQTVPNATNPAADMVTGGAPGQGTSMQIQAGLLTAGNWNDNEKFSDWVTLVNGQERSWTSYGKLWQIAPLHRITVTVRDKDGRGAENTEVLLRDGQGKTLSAGKTDNHGVVYLFVNPFTGNEKETPDRIVVRRNGEEKQLRLTAEQRENTDAAVSVTLSQTARGEKALDFMLMLDTTGSMGDELSYLQNELTDVVRQIQKKNGNLPVRMSVNFYRDQGDDYVVRSNPFTDRLSQVDTLLRQAVADGGGDQPEAVDQALENAISGHKWQAESTKVLILVLDAPPHAGDQQIINRLQTQIAAAAKQGIRILPVLASGGTEETEYLLRSMALMTGGSYTFLTDDSGIGGTHLEATVGDYAVRPLNQLLIDLINGYLD